MGDNDNQITILKQYTQDIIEETYAPILHELKKKLSIALSKEQEHLERLERYEKELEIYRKCHDCHRVNVEKKNVEIQTNGPAGSQANIQAVNIKTQPVYAIKPIPTTPTKTNNTSIKTPTSSSSAKIEDVETITLDDSD